VHFEKTFFRRVDAEVIGPALVTTSGARPSVLRCSIFRSGLFSLTVLPRDVIARATRVGEMGWRDESRFLLGFY
jgi:hypothetical protein